MPEIEFPAGTDPNDPELIKKLQAAEKNVLARHATHGGDLSELADLKDSFTILGQPARPLSAGTPVSQVENSSNSLRRSNLAANVCRMRGRRSGG